jgi:SNF2 family DNA or RNA helicase
MDIINFLPAKPDEKLGKHEGLFTRSYQEAKAVYNAKIRSWGIEYQDNLFLVKNNKNVIEKVYFDGRVQNCSCSNFIEVQCGTCMHIEAIKSLNIENIPQIRPIVFLNSSFEIKQIGRGDGPYFTPSVKPFLRLSKDKSIPFFDIDLSDEDVNVFKKFGIVLFDFQIESIKLMIKNMRSILCLKMGLGKTLCALACCKILNDKNKIIIVAPNSLKFQWQSEINRLDLGSSLVITKGDDFLSYKNQRFLITSYEMLNNHQYILNEKFDIVIADEIQKIRNPESKSWATLSQFKSDFIFSLSGTPIQNNVKDLLSLITFLSPNEIKPEWKFYEEYCNFSRAKMYGIKANKIDDLKEKFKRYIINPVIDYSKFKLPDKVEKIQKVELSELQTTLHNDYFDLARPLLAKSINYPLSFGEKLKLNSLLTLARMAVTDARLIKPEADPSDRILKIQQRIEEVISSGQKIIVYSEWIKSLKLIQAYLDTKNIGYVCFNGTISAKARNKNLNKFITDDKIKVFLSTDSGGLGVDGLQLCCNNLIHVEQLWNPMKIEQRNGRLVRNLQKKDIVNVFIFKSDSDVEFMLDEGSERKHSVIKSILM